MLAANHTVSLKTVKNENETKTIFNGSSPRPSNPGHNVTVTAALTSVAFVPGSTDFYYGWGSVAFMCIVIICAMSFVGMCGPKNARKVEMLGPSTVFDEDRFIPRHHRPTVKELMMRHEAFLRRHEREYQDRLRHANTPILPGTHRPSEFVHVPDILNPLLSSPLSPSSSYEDVTIKMPFDGHFAPALKNKMRSLGAEWRNVNAHVSSKISAFAKYSRTYKRLTSHNRDSNIRRNKTKLKKNRKSGVYVKVGSDSSGDEEVDRLPLIRESPSEEDL